MTRKTFLAGIVLLMAAAGGQTVRSQGVQTANNPYIGTWIENTEKSTYGPGQKPPLLNMHKFEPWDVDGVRCSIVIVDAEGKERRSTYFLKYDGNYYPVVGDEGRDAISSKRVDALTFENSSRKQGKGGGGGGRHVFSADGKTFTLVNSRGQAGRVYSKVF
jgi:hypothetical protein